MEFVQVNLTTPYLFFIVPSTRVAPKPEKNQLLPKEINLKLVPKLPKLPKLFNLPKLP